MAKGNNSGLNLSNMFAGVSPIETPAPPSTSTPSAERVETQHTEEVKSNNGNISNISNKSNILNTNKRGRKAKEEKADWVKRTFQVDPELWENIQYLARLRNMPTCDLLIQLMQAEVNKNAALLAEMKRKNF